MIDTRARRRVRSTWMNRLLRGRPVLGWLALTVALFAVMGHVCVLPHEAHAAPVEPSESHGHDEHSQHDALHTASCEAVPSSVTPAASVLQVTGSVIATTFGKPGGGALHAPRAPAIDTSPPLFLLYSALRL